jgi:hypothetical protein
MSEQSKIEYFNSELWKNIEYNNDSERLLNVGRAIASALKHWTEEGNEEQKAFFEAAKNHWCHVASGRPDSETLKEVEEYLKKCSGTQLTLI